MLGVPDRALLSKPIMAMGCMLCFQGAKAVIFVTGLCGDNCYYCPVSKTRLYHDVFYVNEKKVKDIEEALLEIQRTGATSASLTGGDPLARPERTISLIQRLKEYFGPNFHLHLYTSGRYATRDILETLDKVGLDEIRFHPTIPGLERRIEQAVKTTSMSVGAEVPAIPREENKLLNLALYLDKIKADFLNINELEISESNFNNLLLRGFKPDSNGIVVKGSRETALFVIREAIKKGLTLPIHFCPASFKDNIQTRNRFRMTVKNDRRIYEQDTGTGTIKYIKLFLNEDSDCEKLVKKLSDTGYLFRHTDYYLANPEDKYLLTSTLKNCIKKAWLIESHPTHDRLMINQTRII